MKYIKYFESVNNGYERISYDIYSQSLNKLKGIPFDSTDITKIKSVVSGDVQTISDPKPVRTDKKKYMIKIKGSVPFLGWGKDSAPLYVTISKYEDEWFFVHITISNYSRPDSIGASDQSFWKCDQIESVVDLIKNEIRVEL